MKRPNPWLLLARLIGCYWFGVGAWWAISMVNQSIQPTRQIVPFVNRDTWVVRPAWWMGAGLAALLAARVVYVARRPGLHRYGTARWNKALEAAKLVKDDGPQARMVGRVRTVDETTIVLLRLPDGLTVPQVQAKAEHIAAAMDVAVERLHLSKHDGRGSMLKVRIDPPVRDLKPRLVELPEQTSWRDPVLLGRDMRGRDVTAPTWDVGQWLVGGITGSGKTTLLRLLAAHYALDESAVIWGCDGKGSRDDWGPLRGRVTRWVDVTDPDASNDYITMLRDVGDEVAARNKAGGRDHPGMLVILEEATALRAGLGNAETVEADKLLVRIVQTCRSANVLVVVAAQRPSATLMSTNVRAQAGVGVCMRVRSMVDAEMVLGYRPEVALPETVGRGLLDVGDGTPRAVLVDHLTNDGWRDVCASWPLLRLVPPLEDDEPEDAPVGTPPLLVAAREMLTIADRPLTGSELFAMLDADGSVEEVFTSPVQLGHALSELGFVARKRRIGGVQGRFYDVDALSLLLSQSTAPDGTVGQGSRDAVPL